MKAVARIGILALGLVANLAPVCAADGWEKLQRGQAPNEVSQSVGVPLLRQAARGFETWIYDEGGCVQFSRGRLTGWTAPKRPVDPMVRSAVVKVTATRTKAAPVARATQAVE